VHYAHANSSQFVFTSRCWVTAPNNIDSSASVFNGSCPHWLATPTANPSWQLRHILYWLKRERDRVTLRQAVYRQTVRLGAKPLEAHDLSLFSLYSFGAETCLSCLFPSNGYPLWVCYCGFHLSCHNIHHPWWWRRKSSLKRSSLTQHLHGSSPENILVHQLNCAVISQVPC
jgi:hypothetical protein